MSGYEQLLAVFADFRELSEPVMLDTGVPDYTAPAMAEQYSALRTLQATLAELEPSLASWPVKQQTDFHIVRSEMCGLEFFHRVTRPWARDPVFYLLAGHEGPTMSGFDGVLSRRGGPGSEPLAPERKAALLKKLQALPLMYEQAKANLSENIADTIGDMAGLALSPIYGLVTDVKRHRALAEAMAASEPEVSAAAETAALALEEYGTWLAAHKDEMLAHGGVGIENYDWWLKHVHLFPYTWADCHAVVQHEYSRVISFLKLEEHRNRKLDPLPENDTSETYYRSLDEALHGVLDWLDKEEILTVPEWLDPKDYSDPSEERNVTTTPSIDHKVRVREILPGETHEFVGHLFDEQRQERQRAAGEQIRGVERLYNMEWLRAEGFAVASEELFMIAGVLDDRPRRGREIPYLMAASHKSLSIPDLMYHSQQIDFDGMRQLCAEIMPYEWSHMDEPMVWFEMESNARYPAFHTGCVMGKSYFMKIFRDVAQQQGDRFVLRDFIDSFLNVGMIPMALTRWELTGLEDEMRTLGLIDGEAVEASAVTVPAVVSIGVVGSGAKL